MKVKELTNNEKLKVLNDIKNIILERQKENDYAYICNIARDDLHIIKINRIESFKIIFPEMYKYLHKKRKDNTIDKISSFRYADYTGRIKCIDYLMKKLKNE